MSNFNSQINNAKFCILLGLLISIAMVLLEHLKDFGIYFAGAVAFAAIAKWIAEEWEIINEIQNWIPPQTQEAQPIPDYAEAFAEDVAPEELPVVKAEEIPQQLEIIGGQEPQAFEHEVSDEETEVELMLMPIKSEAEAEDGQACLDETSELLTKEQIMTELKPIKHRLHWADLCKSLGLQNYSKYQSATSRCNFLLRNRITRQQLEIAKRSHLQLTA